jgi:O-antigen ligase
MVTSQTAMKPRPWIECLPGGFLAAVVVCRLLTPTDAAPTGETLWIAQAALGALLVWACVAYRSQQARLRLNWVDMAVGLFCLGPVVGALAVISTSGDKRAAMTMLWEWVGIAVTWFLMRAQLTCSLENCRLKKGTVPAGNIDLLPEDHSLERDSPLFQSAVFVAAERKAMLLVVAAAAVSLSALGIWQHHFGYAASRRTYEKLKSEKTELEQAGRPNDLRKAVDWDRAMHKVRAELVRLDIPANDAARMLWEQRLYSSEPIGMFALANTLAGVLVCTCILWLGILAGARRAVPTWALVLGVILLALILYCLLLTKSRTAFVGLACGLGLWGAVTLGFRSAGLRRIWLAVAAAVAVLAVLVGIAAATGGLDRLVISESTKSLRYRFEYWESTWHMLMAAPRNWLLGVGPGNFRQHYLQFKLPQSSEEIADPHNLVLDVWANGGLIALLGLAGICLAGLRPLWMTLKTEASSHGLPSDLEENPHDSGSGGGVGILAGAVVGHLVVLLLGLGSEETLVLLVLGWLLAVIASGILFRSEPAPSVYGAAFAALAVHLLGAGGVGMPAITQMLLFWVALGEANAAGKTGESTGGATGGAGPRERWIWELGLRVASARIGFAGLGLFLGCWFTGLSPSLDSRSKIADGMYEWFDKGNVSKAEREFRHAADADPWSSAPYERLAELAFQRWQASGRGRLEDFERSVKLQQQAIACDPRQAGEYLTLGEMYIAGFKHTGKRSDAVAAAEAMRQAVALYPNFAVGQSQLAEALRLSGQPDEARQAARRALEVDAINERAGHIDKRLPAGRRELMAEILADGG